MEATLRYALEDLLLKELTQNLECPQEGRPPSHSVDVHELYCYLKHVYYSMDIDECSKENSIRWKYMVNGGRSNK